MSVASEWDHRAGSGVKTVSQRPDLSVDIAKFTETVWIPVKNMFGIYKGSEGRFCDLKIKKAELPGQG